MAALLDLIHLRQHALPEDVPFGIGRSAGCRDEGVRPRLRAVWHIGADGRPACAWRIDTDNPGDPPG